MKPTNQGQWCVLWIDNTYDKHTRPFVSQIDRITSVYIFTQSKWHVTSRTKLSECKYLLCDNQAQADKALNSILMEIGQRWQDRLKLSFEGKRHVVTSELKEITDNWSGGND